VGSSVVTNRPSPPASDKGSKQMSRVQHR